MQVRDLRGAIGLATALFVVSGAGCAAQREVVAEPLRLTRSAPVAVAKQAWPAIVETLLLQGELIQTAQSTLNRVTFRRSLAEAEFRRDCDPRAVTSIDVDSWRYMAGSIEVAIWLDGEGAEGTSPQLVMEGRCRARFDIPTVRREIGRASCRERVYVLV